MHFRAAGIESGPGQLLASVRVTRAALDADRAVVLVPSTAVGQIRLAPMNRNLKAVAERAGVSLATASRVLSGSSYPVSEELRDRVRAVAAELDYVPNAQARSLITGNASMIGILVGQVGDPYFDAMVYGVQSVVAQHSSLVTIVETARSPERELVGFRQLQSHGAGVIMVAGSGLSQPEYRVGLQARIRSFLPVGQVVLMGRHDIDRTLPVIRVESDNIGAGRALGEHLRALGHSQVGVLSGLSTVSSTVDRIQGLTQGLGTSPIITEVPQTRDGGYSGTGTLLSVAPGLTAVVATADQMAIGALAYCAQHGISVPTQLSVAGCNDIWVSRDLVPSLTTVHIPLEEMAAVAMRLALTAARPDGIRHQVFPVRLIPRDSTGPSPDAPTSAPRRS